MTVEDQKAQEDIAEAERLIADVPLIPELEYTRVELYTDHTGDPSFQIVLRIRSGVDPDPEFIKRLVDFIKSIQIRILHSNLQRFPYTRVEEAA